jgi:hypothetical protein
MHRRRRTLVAGAAVCAALFACAFVAAPNSCQWGLDAYFWTGVACLVALFALPFALRACASIAGRAGFGIGLVALGIGVWLAGLFAANVRIICTLL